jgi:putative PIN family toxin of toxin-antitoxin system
VRRIVIDPGVLVSALITPGGPPGELLRQVQEGGFALIASPQLLDELEAVLQREKFRRYVDLDAVHDYIGAIRRMAAIAVDPVGEPPLRCEDPHDDYLIALAHSQNATLVSGDRHLLDLSAAGAPILAPADLL